MTVAIPQSLVGYVWDVLRPYGEVIASPGTGMFLNLLFGTALVLLLHRYNLLSYGSERDTALSELFFAVSLFLLPYSGNVPILWEYILSVLLILSAGSVLLSYALKMSPFVTFKTGFGIGLLSVVHPVYFLFAPYLLYKFSRLRLLSTKHFSAFIMAIAAAWQLSVFLFAVPTSEGIKGFLWGHLSQIAQPNIPEGKMLIFLLGLLIILGTVSAKVYTISPRSIARHKWVLTFQTGIAWVSFVFALIYSDLAVLAIIPLFYLSSILRHLISESGSRDKALGWLFFSGIGAGLGLMAWSFFGNPSFTFIPS